MISSLVKVLMSDSISFLGEPLGLLLEVYAFMLTLISSILCASENISYCLKRLLTDWFLWSLKVWYLNWKYLIKYSYYKNRPIYVIYLSYLVILFGIINYNWARRVYNLEWSIRNCGGGCKDTLLVSSVRIICISWRCTLWLLELAISCCFLVRRRSQRIGKEMMILTLEYSNLYWF